MSKFCGSNAYPYEPACTGRQARWNTKALAFSGAGHTPLGKGVRVEQSSVFVTGVAVGHAGEVVGNCALET